MNRTPSSSHRVRRVLHAIAGITVIALLAGCHQSPLPSQSVALRLGAYEWPGNYWMEVAWQKGWFAEAGLKVDRIEAEGHYFESLDALAAGKIDIMGFSQFDLVRYVVAGHDLIGIAALDYSEGAEALIALPEIDHVRDLRGQRIALHRATYLEYLLGVAAERASLDLNAVTLVDLPEETSLAELEARRIQAVFTWEPYATRAQKAVGGQRLFSTADFPGLAYNVLTVPRKLARERPADLAALLHVWQRATQFVLTNPEETYLIVAKAYHQAVSVPRDLVKTDRILDLADNKRAFSYAGGYESLHASWRRMNDFMMEHGLATTRISSPGHLDSHYLGALDDKNSRD